MRKKLKEKICFTFRKQKQIPPKKAVFLLSSTLLVRRDNGVDSDINAIWYSQSSVILSRYNGSLSSILCS